MGNALHQPSGVANFCALLLVCLEVVFKNNASMKQLIGSCQYLSCLLFLRKWRDSLGWSTVWMPLCMVSWTVHAAVLTSIPQLVARICGVSRGPADAERTIEMFACIVSQSQSSVVIYSRDLLQSYLNSVGVR
jgi:hypothetical protein